MRYSPHEVPDGAVEALRPAFARSWLLNGDAEYWIQRCRQDYAQLWRSDDGEYWAVTEVLTDPVRGDVLHLVASAGKFRQCLLEEVERWGKEFAKCRFALTGGRRGWEKRLTSYKLDSIVLVKEL